MQAALFDTHVHFDGDAVRTAALVERARVAGVDRMLAVGGSVELNAGAAAAAQEHPGTVSVALGFDRAQTGSHTPAAACAWLADSERPRLSAIGEIGLDYHHHPETREAQLALFEAQLAFAVSRGLPAVIHTREADEDTLAVLRRAAALPGAAQRPAPGVIHCFTGGPDFAGKLLELGYFLSFSGIVTFRNADSLRAVAAAVPEDRLLIETDTPYLTPVPLRGKPNEPAFVASVAACVARVRGCSVEALAASTRANACRLFGLSD